MMSDPEVHSRHVARGRRGYATVEVGHAQTRAGIIVELPTESKAEVRMVLEDAFDRGGALADPAATDPGWWAALVCASGFQVLGSASLQRTPARAALHAIIVVERGSMLHPRPAWPLVRMSPTGPWLDLRGETALALGPSDAELEAYALEAGIDRPIADLLRMFEFGVIEWDSGTSVGRRRLVHAGA